MPVAIDPHRSPAAPRPLASFVLRLRGHPDSLRYYLLNLRDGTRRVFRRPQSMLAFLQAAGLRPNPLPDPATAPEMPSRANQPPTGEDDEN